jgi:hypothetical protein
MRTWKQLLSDLCYDPGNDRYDCIPNPPLINDETPLEKNDREKWGFMCGIAKSITDTVKCKSIRKYLNGE